MNKFNKKKRKIKTEYSVFNQEELQKLQKLKIELEKTEKNISKKN